MAAALTWTTPIEHLQGHAEFTAVSLFTPPRSVFNRGSKPPSQFLVFLVSFVVKKQVAVVSV
jgi:hypothetical protein